MCVGRNVFTNKKSDEALNGDLGGIAADRDLLNALHLHGIVCGNGMPGGAAGGSFVGLFCLRSGRKEDGVEHGCTCTEAGILLDIFTPMREDFV